MRIIHCIGMTGVERGQAIVHLRDRHVHCGRGPVVEAVVPHIAYDSDDCPGRIFEFRTQGLSDGHAAPRFHRPWAALLGHRLVDHHYRLSVAIVALAERPPSQQRNVKHLEILRRDTSPPPPPE